MTAEIVIMNRGGVSLAADSAVTAGVLSVKKIFTTANKIFTMSKYNPIGIMFYNLASFMGIPWEVLIKEYRRNIGEKGFANIDDAATDFIEYINRIKIPNEVQERYIESSLYGYFSTARECIGELLRKNHGDKLGEANLSMEDIEREFVNYFQMEKDAFATFESTSFASEVSRDDFIEKYKDKIFCIVKGCISEFSYFAETAKETILEVSYSYFAKRFSSNYSGLVIVGYGNGSYFPSLRSFLLYGKVMDRLVLSKYISDDITLEPNHSARIYSFAQDEMAQIFTQGIDKKYRNDIIHYFHEILNNYSSTLFSAVNEYIPDVEKSTIFEKLKESDKEIFQKTVDDLNKYECDRFLFPLLRIIEIMPKEELAQLAESLVSITALKMKVTLQDETVGGPTDVATITKGDGFVWIKRKHYFQSELNSAFFMNYQRSADNGARKKD